MNDKKIQAPPVFPPPTMFYQCAEGQVINLWQIVQAVDTKDDTLTLHFSNSDIWLLHGLDAQAVSLILFAHSIHAPRPEAPIVVAQAGSVPPA